MLSSQQTTPKSKPEVVTDCPVVLVAADENYVRPLAVTLLSAAKSLRPGSHLRFIVLDGGICDSSWKNLRATLADFPVSLESIKPDLGNFEDLDTSHHISRTAYFRLLSAELLPADIDRVIYLDSDVLVQEDLNQLWDIDLQDNYCLAAVDIACPFINAVSADPVYRKSLPFLASLKPVPNWEDLGLDPSAAYFNSGVMVLNLARWRRDDVGQNLLQCLRENREHVWCWDQYALNVVFAGSWKRLPARWNQGAHTYEYPKMRSFPIPPDEFLEMRERPAIIHYTTEYKPWDFRSSHPDRALFFQTLDQTAWRHWRPEKPPFRMVDAWNQFAAKSIRKMLVAVRKIRFATLSKTT